MLPILLAAAATTAASTQQQPFNLECIGSTRTFVVALLSDKTEAFHTTLRLDPASNKWCEDECKITFPFQMIAPVVFVLSETNKATLSETFDSKTEIDRETGKYSSRYTSWTKFSGKISSFTDANCTKQPFTGWPKVETKF